MFNCKGCAALERERLVLLSTISDLHSTLATQTEAFAKERAEILDRFTAILSPAAYKAMSPSLAHRPAALQPTVLSYPGSRPDLRPPDPPESYRQLPEAAEDASALGTSLNAQVK